MYFFFLFPVSLSPQEANQFLSRHRRANQVFEETKQGHLERECVEEKCTKEEAREVFENDPETVSRVYKLLMAPKNTCKSCAFSVKAACRPPLPCITTEALQQ